MEPVTFTIPRPFSANAMYVTSGMKRYKSNEYKAWVREAGWTIRGEWSPKTRLNHPLMVRIEIPKSCRMDVDNVNKPILDMLKTRGVISDDRIIVAVDTWKADRQDVRITIKDYADE
jgi:Holliday junction resolvase RusA-like endonuclease